MFSDKSAYSNGTFVQIRRLAFDHFDGHYSQTPYIDLGAVLFTRDNLGRHPVRRANHCVALRPLGRNLRTKAKVGKLHRAVHAKQNVVRLDVAVDHLIFVQKLQSLKHL